MIFLGPPGTGKTHLSIALGVQAARRGHRVAFASAQQWVARLAAAKRQGRLDEELEIARLPLIIVDEVGYIPFDPEAAALFFALVSSRYERSSIIVSSNKTFSGWPRSSATRWRSPPSSTGSCITLRSSCCAETATTQGQRQGGTAG